jgi:hypothetical protein
MSFHHSSKQFNEVKNKIDNDKQLRLKLETLKFNLPSQILKYANFKTVCIQIYI